MREIKFRGKHIETGEWVYGYLIGKDVIVGEIVEWDDQYFCTEFWNKVDPETVGQLIGLKDKNGKNYYEGDIFTNGKRLLVIAWHDITAQWAVEDPATCIGHLDMNEDLHEYEIVGNIHENPSLLEVSK